MSTLLQGVMHNLSFGNLLLERERESADQLCRCRPHRTSGWHRAGPIQGLKLELRGAVDLCCNGIALSTGPCHCTHCLQDRRPCGNHEPACAGINALQQHNATAGPT